MKYEDFLAAETFSQADLLAFAHGNLIEDPPEGFAAMQGSRLRAFWWSRFLPSPSWPTIMRR